MAREDVFKFQKAGDICENCQERWNEKGKSPIALVALPSFTMRYHSPVAICPYCCPPQTPIWMGDLSFKSLGKIQVGDIVIGWKAGSEYIDRRPSRSIKETRKPMDHLCRSEVTALHHRESDLVRVFMESGRELVCTPDHSWFSYRDKKPYQQWVSPQIGATLRHVIQDNSLEKVDPYVAGYLAGIYDGDGGDLRIHQDPTANPETFARIGKMLDALGVSYTRSFDRHGSYNIQGDFTLTGGRQGYLDFLSKVAPAKSESLIAHILTSQFSTPDLVVEIEPYGERDVISMTTTTGNYVAWGYASKNCDGPIRDIAMATAKRREVNDSGK